MGAHQAGSPDSQQDQQVPGPDRGRGPAAAIRGPLQGRLYPDVVLRFILLVISATTYLVKSEFLNYPKCYLLKI